MDDLFLDLQITIILNSENFNLNYEHLCFNFLLSKIILLCPFFNRAPIYAWMIDLHIT